MYLALYRKFRPKTFDEVIEKIEKIDDESIEIVKKQIFSDGKSAKVGIGEVNA